jgi:UDP-N-acetylglucosamine:LPS N-acetylglucosamine transferase
MQIAVIAEIAPAKTFIPIIRKLNAEIIGLTHGNGVNDLLGEFCTEIHHIGKSRGQGSEKRTNAKIASLVLADVLNVVNVFRAKKIDLLMTCGNAGDVRKGIAASKLMRIPTLHIEQDIYNPIEMIAFSNLITAPSLRYAQLLTENYGLKQVKVIGGYPMASYVDEIQLKDVFRIKAQLNMDDYILLVLGGDIRGEEVPQIIKTVEKLQENIIIIPFRFDPEYVRNLIKSPNLKVLDVVEDILSIMNASSTLIYGAGMGLTIEAGVLGVPSIKIAGFHRKHASVDLAMELGIPVVKIEEIQSVMDGLKNPKAKELVKEGEVAVSKVVSLINNFEYEKGKAAGFTSFRRIWKARSQFR